MKRFILTSLLCFGLFFWSNSQNVFNINGDNNLFSNPVNWSEGTPVYEAGTFLQFNNNASLDITATAAQIRSGVSGRISNGGGILNVTGYGYNGGYAAILQTGGTGGTFTVDATIIFDSDPNDVSPPPIRTFQVNGTDGALTFGPNSNLTINQRVDVRANSPGQKVNFDGIIQGSQVIRMTAGTTVFFGETSDNSQFNSDIVFIGDANVTVNTAENLVFLPEGQKVQVNQSNGTLTINNKNVYQGNLTVGGSNTFNLMVNADQPNMRTLLLPNGAATLNLTLGAEVDSIHFGPAVESEGVSLWNSNATVAITNFKNAALRFGTSDTSLTVAQLAQIDVGGATLAMNKSGYVVDPAMNTAPEGSQGNLTIAEGFSSRKIDLYSIFTDAQNDSITFSDVISSSEATVTVALKNNSLIISEVATGTSTISVTATDEFGASTQFSFDVIVDSIPDADGDGVPDDDDQCPNTPSGESVDNDGCSDSQKDADGDGIPNNDDQCPNTPAGETVDGEGCAESQKDADGDGITNDVDLCPDTPSGSTVDSDGCADSQKDTDGDGVTDDEDQCADTPSGTVVDANGCVVLSSDLASTTAFIYPNPAQHHLTINNLSKWEGGQLAIIDMSGRVLIAQKVLNEQNKMSIDQLKAGKYILKLQKGSDSETLSFIKGK